MSNWIDIVRVEGRDIFSYESIDLELADRGLVLISGHNKDDDGLDSNAAGKTTIFKIIAWTLFGHLRIADNVIRIDSETRQPVKGKTFGKVTLNAGGDIIEIIRYRKHDTYKSSLRLYLNGNEITTSSVFLTQKKINEILKMDYRTFCSTVMFPQSAAGFASGTDEDQKAILERILHLKRFSDAQENLKARRKEYTSQLAISKAEQSQLLQRMQEAVENIKQLQMEHSRFEEKKVQDLAEAQSQLNEIDEKKPFIDPQISERIRELTDKRVTFSNLEKDMAQVRLGLEERIKKEVRHSTELEMLRSSKLRCDNPPPKPNIPSEQVLRTLNNARSDLSLAKVDLADANKQVVELAKKIQKREETRVCYTCGQTLTEEIKDQIFGVLSDDMEAAKLKMEYAEKAIAAHTKAVTLCEEQFREAEAWEKWEAVYLIERDTDRKIAELETYLTQLREEIAKYKKALSDAEGYLETFRSMDREERELRSIVAQHETELKRWNDLREYLLTSINNVRISESPYINMLAKEKERAIQLGDRIRELQASVAKIEQELPFIDYWINGFSNSGCKSLLLNHVTPFLNDRANEYLSVLCGNNATIEFNTKKILASGEERNKFNIDISYKYGSDKLSELSGGELRRVDVAILLALGDLVASRALSPIRMRMLDEPFDTLDASGVERVVELLQTKIAPRVGTLLVITHNSDMQALFSNVIRVEKSGGISRIVSS